PDNFIRLVHELKFAADHVWIAKKIAPPEIVTDDRNVFRVLSRWRIGRDQPAPEHRRHAPEVWRPGSNSQRLGIFRNVTVGRSEVPALIRDHAFEGLQLA